ncbi:lactadherin-like [Patiria miniata]|uniref:F5/8 type C domain-containing protein n=1 Tax=Patiria miniata TaxID=46514 RepID=A0A914A5G4_PATMI|nr:lactadherin-like [Patiria miniata]
MEDMTIADGQIRASSSTANAPAIEARLNNMNGKWNPKSTDANPWIEVDLEKSTVVYGIITQGGLIDWYVKKYTVAYQKQPSTVYDHVSDGNGDIKVFVANTNIHSPVTNLFDESVVVMVVRIEPTSWSGGVGLRLELLGCRRN